MKKFYYFFYSPMISKQLIFDIKNNNNSKLKDSKHD